MRFEKIVLEFEKFGSVDVMSASEDVNGAPQTSQTFKNTGYTDKNGDVWSPRY